MHLKFQIIINGYDHKLGLLLNKVVEKLVEFDVDPQRFEVLKDFYTRSLKNWEDEQPYSHSSYYMAYILREKKYSNQELLSAMNGLLRLNFVQEFVFFEDLFVNILDVTVEKFKGFVNDFLAKIKMEWLLYGNLTESVSLCQSRKFKL